MSERRVIVSPPSETRGRKWHGGGPEVWER